MKYLPSLVACAVLMSPAVCSLAAPALPSETTETLSDASPYGEATAIRNIPYVGEGTPAQTFDLYLPKARGDHPLPFVVWMHGGAWELSSKEWDNVKYLVKHGYAIATIDYRLAPAFQFPTQIQDCNAALNFIVDHAATYGLDPKRLVIGGASAGGHLCLLLGAARHEPSFGANPAIQPRALLDFFGPADLNAMRGDLEAAHSEKGLELMDRVVPQLLGGSTQDEPAKARAASPSTYVSAEMPPTLILQGTKDALVPAAQSERLHDQLDKAGVKNRLILIQGAPHDGPAFSTPERQAEVIEFLQQVVP